MVLLLEDVRLFVQMERIREKDKVALDNILMYGKHPSGKEFTYYIEDQGLEICASDQPEELIIVSKQQPFEIREAGLSRDVRGFLQRKLS